MAADGWAASEVKMREAGLPDAAIASFRHYYEELVAGGSGLVSEEEIEPVDTLLALADLDVDDRATRDALDHTVVIKLNGGLGTSMGLRRAKSLLEVKDGESFLDIVARQVLALRRRHGIRLPLVLMNSFHTRRDSLAALEHHPSLPVDVPADFLQNQEPKLRVDDLQPVSWPADPDLEWCPPGHGDLYTALGASGMLDALLDAQYRYAFLSNVDNLGAVLDPRILGWLAGEHIPFVSEQCARAESDRKGGHLARRKRDGRLVLRETAQAPDSDRAAFEDIERHPYFNTNNIWLDLRALADLLDQHEGVLGLPIIRNEKTADPSDADSPAVYQLETAMGSAISVFDGAQALEVPRERFAPVKTTNDLLGLRSDCYVLTEQAHVAVAPQRTLGPIFIDLDPPYFKLLGDFEARFPQGPPSLIACERLRVRGDVSFGRDVVVRGQVSIEHDGKPPRHVDDGTCVDG